MKAGRARIRRYPSSSAPSPPRVRRIPWRYLAVPLAGGILLALVTLHELGLNSRSDDATAGAPTNSVATDLNSSDPWARLRAVQRLRAERVPDTARLLVERLSDADELVRSAAGEELAALGDRSRIDEIVALFDGPYQRPAAIALAKLATEQEHEVLARMYNSPDPTVRRCGVTALARAGELRWRRSGVFPFKNELQKSLADPNEGVRITAARALKRNAPHVEALKIMDWALDHADPLVRKTAALEIAAFSLDAIPLLEKHATDENETVRAAVAYTLRRLKGARG
jgi:HEAT repeat protein